MKQDLQLILKVFDALPLHGILFDRNGIITTANRTFLDTIGLRRKEVTGMSIKDLDPYFTNIKEEFDLLEESSSRTFPDQLKDKKGNFISLEHTLVHVTDMKKEIVASMSHNVSVHNQKEPQYSHTTAFRNAEKRIERANQRKRKFIANINHEIRTPMNAIIGYAEMLAKSELGEQQRRFVDTIRKNSTSLVAIINDIMELSKLETGKVRVLKSTSNLRVLLEHLRDLFTEQAQAKNLTFFCLIEPNLPDSYVIDADHCRQILTNLISNAIKFTDKGKIILSVSGSQALANLESSASSEKLYVLSFQVTDTGRGMSAEEQKNILDLFALQKENVTIHDGKCLGLTLSARLARMMGGDVTLKSIKNQGSTFIFNMPATVSTASGEIEKTEIQSDVCQCSPKTGREKKKQPVLLVVDDMPEMSHLIKIYFTNSPIQVLEAKNQEECLTYASSRQPDLILMDLHLAGVDGREVTQLLRKNPVTKNIPTVAMTGLMPEENSYKPLFDDFLAKPFHLHELQHLVDKYIQVKKNNADLSGTDNALSTLNMEQITSAWNEDLDALYSKAEMSGSLDTASELGEKMHEHGIRTEAEELRTMGKRLKKFALDLDIQGVEQVLRELGSINGKSGKNGKNR